MPLFRDDVVNDERQYTEWIGRKKTSLRRPTLDCGCANGGEVYYHLGCDRLTCQKHADDVHDCGLFGGVKDKDGSEEESVEPEAVPTEPPAVLPRPSAGATEVGTAGPSPWTRNSPRPDGVLDEEHVFTAEELAASLQPDPWSEFTRLYLNNYVRGRAYPGAPLQPGPGQFRRLNDTPVSWVQTPPDDGWMSFPMETDEAATLGIDPSSDGSTTIVIARVDSDGHTRLEVPPPPVDAVVEPDPDYARYECPHPRCEWAKVALDRGVLLDLAEAHELDAHAPRSWWLRWLPGGHR